MKVVSSKLYFINSHCTDCTNNQVSNNVYADELKTYIITTVNLHNRANCVLYGWNTTLYCIHKAFMHCMYTFLCIAHILQAGFGGGEREAFIEFLISAFLRRRFKERRLLATERLLEYKRYVKIHNK